MRFKEVYSDGSDYSLGPFFYSDLAKIQTTMDGYENVIDDLMKPIHIWLQKKFNSKYCMMIAGRREKLIIGYYLIDRLMPRRSCYLHLFKRMNKGENEDRVACGRLLIRYCFKELELQRVAAVCHINNEAAQNVALESGLLKEGIQRGAALSEGVFGDLIMFGLCREDYNG